MSLLHRFKWKLLWRELRADAPKLYGNLLEIEEIMQWQPSPMNLARYVFWSKIAFQ